MLVLAMPRVIRALEVKWHGLLRPALGTTLRLRITLRAKRERFTLTAPNKGAVKPSALSRGPAKVQATLGLMEINGAF